MVQHSVWRVGKGADTTDIARSGRIGGACSTCGTRVARRTCGAHMTCEGREASRAHVRLAKLLDLVVSCLLLRMTCMIILTSESRMTCEASEQLCHSVHV